MSNSSISGHPRLHRRGAVFYLRATIPNDLQAVLGRREVWRSLKTKDKPEALRRLRVASVEFDREMERERAKVATKAVDVLDDAQLNTLADLAQHEFLAVDEQHRAEELTPETAAEDREGLQEILVEGRHRLGSSDFSGLEGYGDRVLAEAGLRMEHSSRGFRRLMFRLLAASVEATEKMLQRADGHPIRTPPPPVLASHAKPYSLDDLIRDYMDDPGASRTAKTCSGYVIIFGVLRELLGADKPVQEITREDCRRARSLLLKVPASARSLYPGLTLEQAAERASRDGRKTLSPGTVNSYLNNMSSLFRWAEREDKITKNPAAGLRVVDPMPDARKRNPFPAEALVAIFTAPLYAGCVDDEAGYSRRGPAHPRRGRFWVPLLSLFHGIRQTEACQLHVGDVREIRGNWCLVLTEEGAGGEELDEADRKRIKTDAGERFVPVHSELIKIGFLNYVAGMAARGGRRLFPDIRRGEDGYFAPFSKWFSRFLVTAGAKRHRVSFHSLRHTYRDALTRAGLPGDTVRALGGWSSGRTEDQYGGDLVSLVPHLADAMARVSFPGLDLSHLYARHGRSDGSQRHAGASPEAA